ncbi:MAG: nitrophenyl compound nitroreductase subunit ArsF family protein [Spirochaetota bacterium]|nr:nitrophenyl compound nitroreductase subunit ArsF family protein [Spirochaetota bacterium]
MNMKKIITIALSLFICISLVYLITDEIASNNEQKTEVGHNLNVKTNIPSKLSNKQSSNQTIIVYYFHTTNRCYSCQRIERLTLEAVQKGFAKEISDGIITWKPVNIEEHNNKHYVKEFKLYTKSVVIVKLSDGKQINWKMLDKTWNLLRDEPKFTEYIQEEIRIFMEKA